VSLWNRLSLVRKTLAHRGTSPASSILDFYPVFKQIFWQTTSLISTSVDFNEIEQFPTFLRFDPVPAHTIPRGPIPN
jgi:hypothetical protein